MTVPHYFAFAGATPSLSTELSNLKTRFAGLRVVAPAVKKTERAEPRRAFIRTLESLAKVLQSDGSSHEAARLSIWTYLPPHPEVVDDLWNLFGRSAWIELVPAHLVDQDRRTRVYAEARLTEIIALMHEVSYAVYSRRRNSPLPLPLVNFHSKSLSVLRRHWYRQLTLQQLKREVQQLTVRFRQVHGASEGRHSDDRSLFFAPAGPEACHGVQHPTGSSAACFINGRFRFGAALYPGFHYDVRGRRNTLECILYDCTGQPRDLRPERREYINVFPNEHLLPEKSNRAP